MAATTPQRGRHRAPGGVRAQRGTRPAGLTSHRTCNPAFPVSRTTLAGAGLAALLVVPACAGPIDTLATFADSGQVTGNTVSTAAVQPPTGVTVAAVNESNVVSWNPTPSTFATGYNIYRSDTSGGPYTPIGTVSGQATTSFTDPQVPTSTTYYVVTAIAYNWYSNQTVESPASAPVTSYHDAVLASTPSLWYRLDEAAGSTSFADSSGNGYTGTLTNSTGTPAYRQPSALASNEGYSMAGSSGNLLSIQPNAYTSPVNTFSLEMWVKPQIAITLNGDATTGIYGTSGQNFADFPAFGQMGVAVGTNGISVYERNSGYMPALATWAGSVPSTSWTHVVITEVNQQPSIYVNGVLVHTGLKSTQPSTAAAVWLFGYGGYTPFVGGLDEFAVYTRALTAAEIADHYNAGARSVRGLATSSTISQVNENWNPPRPNLVTGGYRVYRGTTPSALTAIGTSPTGSYADTSGLTVGRTYYYAIAPITASGEGAKSAPVAGRLHSPYFDAVMASSPYYYWRMSEPAGATSVTDWSGHGFTGTVYGPVTLGGGSAVTSGEGGSASTTGTQREYITNGSITGLASNTFSYEIWAKPTSTIAAATQSNTGTAGLSGQKYVWWPNQGATGSTAGAGLSVGTNGIQVYELSGGYMPPTLVWNGAVSSTAWTHIVVVYNNRTPSLYVNGVLVATGVVSGLPTVTPPTQPGGFDYGDWNGGMAEAAVYNRALSTAEITAHYNAGRQP